MKNVKQARWRKQSPRSTRKVSGPSLFEVEYLRQLKEELEVFLRSRNFSTIKEVSVAFIGQEYAGQMRISA